MKSDELARSLFSLASANEPMQEAILSIMASAVGGKPPPPPSLQNAEEEGTYNPMEKRVTELETHMGYVRRDLDRIDGKLDTLIEQTRNLPTKSDLTTFRWQWLATAAAAVAIIVGGIIGGLGWIKPDPTPPAPTVIQLPAGATSTRP